MSAEILVTFARERGMSAEACLHGSGIESPEALSDPDGEIASWQELRVIRNLVAGLGSEPGSGASVGLRYHLAAYDMLGLGMLTSATVRDAIEFVLRMRLLAYGFCPQSVRAGLRSSAIMIDGSTVPPEVARFVIERDVAAWVVLMRELQPGVVGIRRIEFAFPGSGARERYRELFQTDVTFSGRRNAVVIGDKVLDCSLPQAHPTLRQRYERQCVALIERRIPDGGVVGQVRALLRACDGPMPTLESVAHELLIGTRTLRRQLATELTSFRALRTDELMIRAERLLLSGRLPVERIAAQLGYSESAAFVRAFSRWRGMSPAAYRRQRVP